MRNCAMKKNIVKCISVLIAFLLHAFRGHDLLLFDEFSYSFNLLDANDWDEHHLSVTPAANDYASKCTNVIPVIFKQLCVSWNTHSGFRFAYDAPESVHRHLHDTDWFYADKAQQLSAAQNADARYGRLLDEQARFLGDDTAWNEINYANQISSFTLNSRDDDDGEHNHFLRNFATGSFKQCRHSEHLQECTHFDLPTKTLRVHIKTPKSRRHASESAGDDQDWQEEVRAEHAERASAKLVMPANLYTAAAAAADGDAYGDFDFEREFEYGDARGYHNWAADAMKWDTFECSNCGRTEVRGRRRLLDQQQDESELQSLYQRYGEFTYLFHDHALDFSHDKDWSEISEQGGKKCSIAIPGLEHRLCVDVSHSGDDGDDAVISMEAASQRDIDNGYYDMYGYDMYYYNVDHLYAHQHQHQHQHRRGSEHEHKARALDDYEDWYESYDGAGAGDDDNDVERGENQRSSNEDGDDENADVSNGDTNYDFDYYHTHSDQRMSDDVSGGGEDQRSAQYSEKDAGDADSDAERDSDSDQQQQQQQQSQSQMGTMADERQGFKQGYEGHAYDDPMAQYPDAYAKIKEQEDEEPDQQPAMQQQQQQPAMQQQQQQPAQGMANMYGGGMSPMLNGMSGVSGMTSGGGYGYTRRRGLAANTGLNHMQSKAFSRNAFDGEAAYDAYEDGDEDDEDYGEYDEYDDDVVYEEDLQDLQRFLQNAENDEFGMDELDQLMESEQQRVDAMNADFIASLRDELSETALNFNDDDLWDDITYVHGNGEQKQPSQKWIRKCATFQTAELCATTQHPQHRDLRLNVKIGKHKFHRRRRYDARTAMDDVLLDEDKQEQQQHAAAATSGQSQNAAAEEWAIDENVIDVDDDEWNNAALWTFVDDEAHRTLHAKKVVIRKCRGRSFCLCQYVDVAVDRGQKHKCVASHSQHSLQPHYRMEHAMDRFMAAPPIATALQLHHPGGAAPVHVQFQFRPSIVHLHIMGKYPFFRRRHHIHHYRVPWFRYRRYQHLRPAARPAWCPSWIWRELDMHLKRPQGFAQVHHKTQGQSASGAHLDEHDYYQYDAHELDSLDDHGEIDDDFDDELPFLSPLLRMGTELLPNVLRNARRILPKVLKRSVSKGGFIHSALEGRGGPQHLGGFGGFGGGKIRRSFGDIAMQRKRKHDRALGSRGVMGLFGAPHLRGVPSMSRLRRGMLESIEENDDANEGEDMDMDMDEYEDDEYGEFEYFGQELEYEGHYDAETDAALESEQRSDVADAWLDQETGMDWVMLRDDFSQELQALRDAMVEWQSIRTDIVGNSGRSIQRRCMPLFGRTLCICEFLEFVDALDADHLCYPKKANVFPAPAPAVHLRQIQPKNVGKAVHAPPLPLPHSHWHTRRVVAHKLEHELELRHELEHSVKHKQTRHTYSMEVQMPHSADMPRKKVLLKIRLKHLIEQIVHKMKERHTARSRVKSTHVTVDSHHHDGHFGHRHQSHAHSPLHTAPMAMQQARFRFRRAQMKLLKRRAMLIRNAIKKGLPQHRPLWLPAYFWHWLHFGPHFHVLRHKLRTPWQMPHPRAHSLRGEKQKLHVLDLKKKHDKKIAAHQEADNLMEYDDIVNLNDAYDDDVYVADDAGDVYDAIDESYANNDLADDYRSGYGGEYDANEDYEYSAFNDLSAFNALDEEEDYAYEFDQGYDSYSDRRNDTGSGKQFSHAYVWMVISVSLVLFCLCTFCTNIGLRRRRRKIHPTHQEQQYLQQALEITESESGQFDQ